MRLRASHDLLLVLELNLSPLQSQSQSQSQSHLNTNPSLFPIPHSLSFFTQSPTRSNSVHGRVHSTLPFPRISSHSHSHSHLVPETIVILTYTTLLLFLRLFSNALLLDFPRRWRNLIAFSAEAELRASSYPWHVWQAIVAYEDRRFFKHCGIDPVGITCAVLSFSARGGGSRAGPILKQVKLLLEAPNKF
ncbi:penicillin-binding [Fagus crenata]